MLSEVNEIRILRKKHSLTQSQLAKLSGVSQSLIAKVEAGVLDPSYSNFRKISDVLEGIGDKEELKAGAVARGRIISAEMHECLSEAVKKMRQHGISQLPVIEKGNVTGLLAETNVIESIHAGKDIKKLKVSDAMGEAPPTVPEKTPLKVVTELLRVSPLVVVTEKGKPAGVITKADVLNRLAK